MRSASTLALRKHGTISPPADGDVLVTASVGPWGEVIALWSATQDAEALRARSVAAGGASFADPMAPRPVPVRVTTHSPRSALLAKISDLGVAHPFVQPLPGDRILVVGARSRWRPGGADRNAVIFDVTGDVLAQEVLGDGIGHVLATSAGDVWAGYFDEGVYGNHGWGRSGAAEPIGASGLIRFSPDLRPAWRFPYEGGISDVYALNVSDDETWTCYYTDFPVVRIRDDSRTAWRNDVSGASALAVSGTRVALFGGYGAEASRLCVGVLEGHSLNVTSMYRLTLPGRKPFPPDTRVVGRGAELHFLSRDAWYKLSVDDVPR